MGRARRGHIIDLREKEVRPGDPGLALIFLLVIGAVMIGAAVLAVIDAVIDAAF